MKLIRRFYQKHLRVPSRHSKWHFPPSLTLSWQDTTYSESHRKSTGTTSGSRATMSDSVQSNHRYIFIHLCGDAIWLSTHLQVSCAKELWNLMVILQKRPSITVLITSSNMHLPLCLSGGTDPYAKYILRFPIGDSLFNTELAPWETWTFYRSQSILAVLGEGLTQKSPIEQDSFAK